MKSIIIICMIILLLTCQFSYTHSSNELNLHGNIETQDIRTEDDDNVMLILYALTIMEPMFDALESSPEVIYPDIDPYACFLHLLLTPVSLLIMGSISCSFESFPECWEATLTAYFNLLYCYCIDPTCTTP